MRNPTLAALSGPDAGSSLQQDAVEDRIVLPWSQVLDTSFARILFNAGLAPSKSEGARMVAKGGVYIASKTPGTPEQGLSFVQIKDQKPENITDFMVDGLLILRIGKWKVRVIEVVDDEAVHA